MPYRDFREYVTALEKEGEVQRIQQEVDWDMEAGAITRRSYEIKARAPFFQKIKDYPEGYRIFGAPLSSTKRIALTMEMDPDSSFMELSHEFRRRTRNPIKPIVVKDGPCKENIQTGDDINLFQFPAPMVHDGDGGRYICTWHVDVNQDPDSDWVNWGMYRKMIHNKNTMGGIMLPFQHMPYIFFNKYEAKGKPMEFATAIAPEPVVTFAGCTMFPAGVTEADMAGAIRKEPVELVKCETVDLYVPATSEIVFEGYVSP
ncbi:MAG: UbiD family decarboxylase, partial [Thermodesulfobacteriota bacterium]|nr:UbiD family decarboxylase [Thermodesulfobacteriota bacterium]